MTHLFGTDDGEDVAVQRVVVREGGAALVGEGVLGQQLLVAVRPQQRRQRLQAMPFRGVVCGVGWCGVVWCGVVWCVSEQCVEMSSSGRQVRGTA